MDIREDGFLQFIFNNADFNIRTIDGFGAFHNMGCVQCMTPVTTVSVSINTSVQQVKDVNISGKTCGTIQPMAYKKPTTTSGLENITANTSISCDTYQPESVKHAQ